MFGNLEFVNTPISPGTRSNYLMALSTISRLSVNAVLEVFHFEIVSTKTPKLVKINVK